MVDQPTALNCAAATFPMLSLAAGMLQQQCGVYEPGLQPSKPNRAPPPGTFVVVAALRRLFAKHAVLLQPHSHAGDEVL
jgi:hypothetical protein